MMSRSPSCTVMSCVAVLLLSAGVCSRVSETRAQSPSKHQSEWVVDVNWLKAHLNDRNLIIADTRTDSEYLQGHLPGAILFDISDLNPRTAESGLTVMHEQLAKKFSALGIEGTEQVVFYDESMGTKAPKALWYFTYAGNRR